ncbi:hypothetical protein F8S13_19960 [Chloroflexia bacterium SDU3-3]|nr:hypothetical protein F8S13_19960 [Chloroflexia bacterium SDU3-3]
MFYESLAARKAGVIVRPDDNSIYNNAAIRTLGLDPDIIFTIAPNPQLGGSFGLDAAAMTRLGTLISITAGRDAMDNFIREYTDRLRISVQEFRTGIPGNGSRFLRRKNIFTLKALNDMEDYMGYMFDVMRFLCRGLDDQKKLSNLGIESMKDIQIIRSYSRTMREKDREIPDDVLYLLNRELIKSIDVVVDIYFAVLFPDNREGMGMSELRPHNSFLDAVRSISKVRVLDLSSVLDSEDMVDVEDRYPLVIRRKYGNNLKIYLLIEDSIFVIRYIYAEFGDRFTIDETKEFTSIYDAVDEIDDLIKRLP